MSLVCFSQPKSAFKNHISVIWISFPPHDVIKSIRPTDTNFPPKSYTEFNGNLSGNVLVFVNLDKINVYHDISIYDFITIRFH